ncbi:MAG: hypothetical protein Q9188_005052 [Gyalolechia gomerana]
MAAEALGLASGLLTLTVAAYKTSKSLYEAVSSFQSQRKTIKDIQAHVQSLVTLLEKIQEQIQSSQEIERLEPLQQPLNCCNTACQEMLEMLDACTTHGKDGRKSVRDWLNMRYHEKSFEDIKQRLVTYESTLGIAFDSIMIHSITQDSLAQIKNSIDGTREDIEDQLDQVQQTISTAEASLREVLQDDQARLQSSLDSLAQAQKITDGIHPDIVIQRNRAGQSSRAIFGTDTLQPQFNLTVSDNEAKTGAVVGAGVHTPQTLQTLLGDSRTANLTLALQTQLQSANETAWQSIVNHLSAEHRHGLMKTSSEANSPLSLTNSQHTNTTGILQSAPQSIASKHENSSDYHDPLEQRSE